MHRFRSRNDFNWFSLLAQKKNISVFFLFDFRKYYSLSLMSSTFEVYQTNGYVWNRQTELSENKLKKTSSSWTKTQANWTKEKSLQSISIAVNSSFWTDHIEKCKASIPQTPLPPYTTHLYYTCTLYKYTKHIRTWM